MFRGFVGASVVVFLAAMLAPEVLAAGTVTVPVGQLCSKVKSNGPGTTYLLQDGGTHDARCAVEGIPVQSGDSFRAASGVAERPKVSGMGEAKRVFNIRDASNTSFDGLYVTGAVGDGACEPGCGSAIMGNGANPTVTNTAFADLPNHGIGWSGSEGCLTVRDVRMDNIGSVGFSGMDPDVTPQGRSSAGIKATGPCLDVRDSFFTHTFWSPIWCDHGCNDFTATGNVIRGFGKGGIHVEVSSGPAVVAYNKISGGGVHGSRVDGSVAGILLRRSAHLDVHHNTITNTRPSGEEMNRRSVLLSPYGTASGPSPPPPGFSDVGVRANHVDAPIEGCGYDGVTCRNNR